jgi:acyl-CoA synthetase (AMP-forming)/AMP-acid ligase II
MPGEIVVAGDHVLPGYLNGQGDAETKFRVDGRVWHRTGDAGRLDARGRVWLLGRCVARIDDARGTLYPFGAECAATATPGVARAALVAINGHRVLVVEPAPLSPAPDLKQMKERLAWAAIDDVWSMPIPVDGRHNAKVDYPALRARFEQKARKS